jgi:hypothetical protein
MTVFEGEELIETPDMLHLDHPVFRLDKEKIRVGSVVRLQARGAAVAAILIALPLLRVQAVQGLREVHGHRPLADALLAGKEVGGGQPAAPAGAGEHSEGNILPLYVGKGHNE